MPKTLNYHRKIRVLTLIFLIIFLCSFKIGWKSKESMIDDQIEGLRKDWFITFLPIRFRDTQTKRVNIFVFSSDWKIRNIIENGNPMTDEEYYSLLESTLKRDKIINTTTKVFEEIKEFSIDKDLLLALQKSNYSTIANTYFGGIEILEKFANTKIQNTVIYFFYTKNCPFFVTDLTGLPHVHTYTEDIQKLIKTGKIK